MSKRKDGADNIQGHTFDHAILDELQHYDPNERSKIPPKTANDLRALDQLLNRHPKPIPRTTVTDLLPTNHQWLQMRHELLRVGWESPSCDVVESEQHYQFVFKLIEGGDRIDRRGYSIAVPYAEVRNTKMEPAHIREMIWDRVLKTVLHTANEAKVEELKKQPPPHVLPPVPSSSQSSNDARKWRELVDAYRDCVKAGYDAEDIGEVLVGMVEQVLDTEPEPEAPELSPLDVDAFARQLREDRHAADSEASFQDWKRQQNVLLRQEANKRIRISDISAD